MAGHQGVFILCQGASGANGSLLWFNANPNLTGNANINCFSGAYSPTSLASGRLANGNVVIAAALTASNNVLLYEKNASLSRTISTRSGPTSVAFGHFVSTGQEDLAVLNAANRSISIYRGADLFASGLPFENISLPFSNPERLVVSSIRGDGFEDLLVGYNQGCYIIYNKESGAPFNGSATESVGSGISGNRTAICVDDFCNDGSASDIALLNTASDMVEVYQFNPSGSPGSYYSLTPVAYLSGLPNPMSSIVAGNFGGSRDVAAITSDGNLLVFLQQGYGFKGFTFVPDVTLALGAKPSCVAAGDVNDDGLTDIVIGYADKPILAAYLRTGTASFKNAFNFTTGSTSAAVIAKDINGDDRIDIACVSPASHSLSVWFQNNLVPKAVATANGHSGTYSAYQGQSITFSGVNSKDSFSDQGSLKYNWTFLPGSVTANGSIVTHVFNDDGSYIASLRVTDRGGLSNWSNISLTILHVDPTASFTYSPTSPFEGQQVWLNDTSTHGPDPIKHWTWTIEGQKYYTQNVTHVFPTGGNYSVTLSVSDDEGGIGNASKIVHVRETIPTAAFHFTPPEIYEGGTYNFKSDSTWTVDPITNYTWTFGDRSAPGFKANVSHQYLQDGNYTVRLTVKDSDGTTAFVEHQVTVLEKAPTANFTYSPSSPLEGSTVKFDDTSYSYDGNYSLLWEFGDGGTSTKENPTHIYEKNGSYFVTLTVTDPDGEHNTTGPRPIEIMDIVPTADFNTAPNEPVEGQPVHFIDNSTGYDPLVNWTWSFGDEQVGFGSSPWHTYAKNGTYSVKLTVRDSDGALANVTKTLIVSDIAPDASFTAQPNPQYEGTTTWFNDSSTGYDTIVSWYWDFGDGNHSTEQNANHTYMRDGNYTCELTVWDSDGASNSTTTTIHILDVSPTASFVYTQPKEGAIAYFNSTSISHSADTLQNFTWDFGDHHPGFGANATHRFNMSGAFMVVLKVTDSDGSTDYASHVVNVSNVNPVADFTYLPDPPNETDLVNFTDHSFTFNYFVSWYWDLGDGNSSTLQNPSHAYLKNGTYTVTFNVTDADGSWNWTSKQIVVLETNPRIISVTMFPSKQTYNEDEVFQINVSAVRAAYDITHYQFDFHYNGTFTAEADTELNHTSLSYPEMGTYHVMVRVFDDDGYTQASAYLVIEILNVPPHAVFSYRDEGQGMVQFDATQSYDTPSDNALLMFSWYFDDGEGFTAYSSSRIVEHQFTKE
ncbi:MAG: PKD domain-containing protein, partial [Methanomassiliicoccales archaeon]